MTDKSADLVAYAKEIALTTDLFSILGVDATSTNDEIHRAWRRTGLKYHPDKAGDAYDPEKYERITRARDVLLDPAAREAYDRARAAALENERRKNEMSAGRRRMIEELEAAEKAARTAQGGLGGEQRPQRQGTEKLSAEEARQRQDALRAWEDVKRRRREAEESERVAASESLMRSRADDAERDAREAAIEQKLRENAEKKAAKARRKAEKDGAPIPPAHSALSPSGQDQRGSDEAMAAVRRTVADATETATLARQSSLPELEGSLASSIEKTRDSALAANRLVMTMSKERAARKTNMGHSPWLTTKARAAAYQTWRDATAAFISTHRADAYQGSAFSQDEVLAATEKTLQSAQKTEEWLREALKGQTGA